MEDKKSKSQIIISIIVLLSMIIAALVATNSKNKENNNKGNNYYQSNEVNYTTLKCYKTTVRDNYELSSSLTLKYRDGEVTDLEFNFNYFKRTDKAIDGYTFDEVEEIANLDLKGVTTTRKDGNVVINVDFDNNPKLKNNEILKEYAYDYYEEINILPQQKSYSCSSRTETVY